MASHPNISSLNGGNRTTDATSHTLNLPASIAAGDLLIALAGFDGSPTVTWPGGWTSLVSGTTAGSEATIACHYRVADGSEGASISITTSASEQFCYVSLRITNYQGTPEYGGNNSGTSTAPQAASFSPSWGSDLVLWLGIGVYDVGQTFISSQTTGVGGIHQVAGTTSGPNQRADTATGIGIWIFSHPLESASFNWDGPILNASRPYRSGCIAIRAPTPSGGGAKGSAFSG